MSRNPYTQELLRRIENRFSIDTREMSLGDWICANTHIRGKPFTFDRYPFQKAICDDLHPNVDVIKPSQVGLTEVQIRKSLAFLARNRGTTLIFTFPLEKMFKKQSTTRIKPLVEEEKAFNLETRSGEKPVRSMSLYQIGTSFMHVSGATEGDATSISADVVMNDEVDLTDQQMLALFNSRLQNSDWKINQRFSTPTFVNYGIDKGFSVSDQHEYLCRCLACNHWQSPLFRPQFVEIPGLSSDLSDLTEIDEAMIDEGRIDLASAYVRCERCRAPLPLGDPEAREWVPKYPSRSHHRGYRVSPFSTDRLSIAYIVGQMLRYKARNNIRGWFNTVLGEAFTDSSSRLSEADIAACFTPRSMVPEIDSQAPTWLGIDVGQTCHIVVGQGDSLDRMQIVRFLDVPIARIEETVRQIDETYRVIAGAVDRHPYTPTAEALRDMTEGRIQPVEYRGQREINPIHDPLDRSRVTHVQANRTQLLDTVAGAIRRKSWSFMGYGNQKSVITEHLRDMVRDESPETEAKWVKLSGNDHYFHAMAFLVAGFKTREVERRATTDLRAVVALMGCSLPRQENLIGAPSRRSDNIL